MIVSLIGMLVIGVAIGGMASILKALGSSTLILCVISGICLPIEFESINKKYPIGNFAKLEKRYISK